mmetsp:Transcript_5942/g.15459  ORF Transcript_5942/g.15459 Transcript_5942/m.15459 type:complete len:257 (+) Transcript_5942:156-926(+)
MFDFADLAELLLAAMRKKNNDTADAELESVLEGGLSTSSNVRLVSDLSQRNPMVAIKSTESVKVAVLRLLEKSVHRLCVFDADDAFVGVVSFSDILKLVADHVGRLDDLLRPSVEAKGLAAKPPVQLSGDRPVLEALALMVERKVSSVAIVDETDGHLLTAITTTDAKSIIKLKRFEHMRLDCREFAAQVRAKQALEDAHGRETFPFFAVHKDTSIKTLIAKLVAVRAHRLFVVDRNKPVAVIEIPDIFRAFRAAA